MITLFNYFNVLVYRKTNEIVFCLADCFHLSELSGKCFDEIHRMANETKFIQFLIETNQTLRIERMKSEA